MTYIYSFNKKRYTLEALLTEFPIIKKVWNECMEEEYEFWKNISLNDLIAETSELFEETLAVEEDIFINFVHTNTEPFDYNVLFDILR